MAVVGQIPTQADKRRSMTLTDVHGRKYFAVIEKNSGYPTGLVQPLFEVPHPNLVPPQKYMRFPEERPGFLDIDYDAWEADNTAALAEWEMNKVDIAASLPGGEQNPKMARELGPRPMSPLPVRAMRQGNRWALGLSDKKPPEARDFFPDPPARPTLAVFTETEPMTFTPETPETPAPAGGMSLAALLAEVESRCPENYRGAARKAWAMAELQRMAEEPANADT